MTEEEYQEFRSTCRETGKLIDPKTAEVQWTYARIVDPYGIDPMFSDEGSTVKSVIVLGGSTSPVLPEVNGSASKICRRLPGPPCGRGIEKSLCFLQDLSGLCRLCSLCGVPTSDRPPLGGPI
jgi:hypothetical protein